MRIVTLLTLLFFVTHLGFARHQKRAKHSTSRIAASHQRHSKKHTDTKAKPKSPATTELAPEFHNTVYGIDVSRYQGDIEWSDVKHWNNHAIHFVYIKATEGSTIIDQTYARNFKGAKDNEFLIGSYHFFTTRSTPQEQFNNFISTVDKDHQDLIPMVDVEVIRGCDVSTFHDNFKEFLTLVEKHYNKKPLIYTSNSFYNKYLSGKYKDYKFFMGRYSSKTPIINDGHTWTIWQFSEKGKINGVSHTVDINLLNPSCDMAELMLKENNKRSKKG